VILGYSIILKTIRLGKELIRPVTKDDAASICSIYNHYVEHTFISFETQQVSSEAMQKRICLTTEQYPWLVYEIDNKVVAYAYANLWKSRAAYCHTLETTVYAAPDLRAKGIGTKLYQALFEELEATSAHSLLAVIALPNKASVSFHEKMGFVQVGDFKEVGKKFDQWIDVGYWQKLLI